MKRSLILALLLAGALPALAAETSPNSKTQAGRLSTVSLLATARVTGKAAPDGMRFLFLIARKPEATGEFALKETRDFLLGNESYQEKTEAELGKRFEPETMFDNAENFFTRQPNMRRFAPEDIKDAYILALTIGGTKLSAGARTEVTLNVGFNKEVEPLTFRVPVPPGPADGSVRR